MNFEKINIYFVLLFIMAFLVVEKITPLSEEAGAYFAILWWLFIFGVGKYIIEKRELKKEKIGEE